MTSTPAAGLVGGQLRKVQCPATRLVYSHLAIAANAAPREQIEKLTSLEGRACPATAVSFPEEASTCIRAAASANPGVIPYSRPAHGYPAGIPEAQQQVAQGAQFTFS